jgi:hypothetical protein
MAKKITIRNPNNPMTDKQSYLLYRITGVTLYYLEEKPFTVKEASDLIDAAKNGKAYHTRLALAEAGGKVSSTNVHKDYRKDTKPRGYATKMTEIIGEHVEKQNKRRAAAKEPAAAKKTTTKQTKAQKLGLEDVDIEDPRVQAVLKMFAAV